MITVMPSLLNSLQVSENMAVSGLTEESILLIKTAELLSGGQLGNVLFNGTVTVAAAPTTTGSLALVL